MLASGLRVSGKSLSILAVTSEVPWPLDSGGHLRTFHLLRHLATQHRVRLVVAAAAPVEADIEALQAAGITPRIACVSGRRLIGTGLAALRAAARGEPYVMYRRHEKAAVRTILREEIGSVAPDVLYLDHLDSFVYAAESQGRTVVGDLHNVYSLLAARAADEQKRPAVRLYLKREARLLAQAESRAAGTADLLMTVSDQEQRYFQALGAPRVEVVPNGVDCDRYAALPLGRPSGFPLVLYIGAMSWRPNASAARFLAQDVLPALRSRVPDVRLRIIGRDPLPEVLELRRDPSVEVLGPVPDVVPHLRDAHVLAVPLEAGGGTRLKILEAFAAGLPVVSTPMGCEGLSAESGRHLLVAPRELFVEALAEVLLAPAGVLTMAQAARSLVRERYDWQAVGALAIDAIQSAHSQRNVGITNS